MSLPLVRLPSLDLVRGFVAVGRRMSVTLAAQDLCLTQSAVSRQVQALEEMLGVKLLVRGYRSISFTPEGERLFRTADGAVQQLQEVIGELRGHAGRRMVTITAAAGVSGLWLIERLGTFLEAHPEIDVRVSSNIRAIDLATEGIDLAIRYGPRETMPRGAEYLFGETIVPVAHPSLGVQELAGPEDLGRQVLLEFDGPYRPWLQWDQWLASQGWDNATPKAVLRFNQYDQIIHAAVAGQGIALGRQALISAMLSDGRLRALRTPKPGPAPEHAYWLLHGADEPRPEVALVMQWIRDEAARAGA
jgi:DNA-binding transcriptional LysR family regulator